MLAKMKMMTGTETRPVSGTSVHAEMTPMMIPLKRNSQMTGIVTNWKTTFLARSNAVLLVHKTRSLVQFLDIIIQWLTASICSSAVSPKNAGHTMILVLAKIARNQTATVTLDISMTAMATSVLVLEKKPMP